MFDLLSVVIGEPGPSDVDKEGTITLLLEASGRTTDEIIAIEKGNRKSFIWLLHIWIKFNNNIIKEIIFLFHKKSSSLLSF